MTVTHREWQQNVTALTSTAERVYIHSIDSDGDGRITGEITLRDGVKRILTWNKNCYPIEGA